MNYSHIIVKQIMEIYFFIFITNLVLLYPQSSASVTLLILPLKASNMCNIIKIFKPVIVIITFIYSGPT